MISFVFCVTTNVKDFLLNGRVEERFRFLKIDSLDHFKANFDGCHYWKLLVVLVEYIKGVLQVLTMKIKNYLLHKIDLVVLGGI